MTTQLEKMYNDRNMREKNKESDHGVFTRERGELFSGWIGTGKKVLDLGCCNCLLTHYFCKGNEVTGYDVDSEALTHCKKEIHTEQKDLNSDWHIDTPKHFDVVVSSEVVEHIFFPEQVCEKVASILKDDGMFMGSVPNAFNFKNRIRLFLNYKELTPLAEPTHITHFGYSDLHAMLSKHFEEVEIVPIVQEKWRPLAKVFPGLASFLLAFKASTPKRPIK